MPLTLYVLKTFQENELSDMKEMLEFHSLQSDAVRSGSTVVDQEMVGQDFMLHIDKNTPAVFTPRMPPSADEREDMTCARITVAPTLWGCYIGYNRAHDDFAEGSAPKQDAKDAYRGGYEICELPFEYALKVDTALVPDAEKSQEHWLVAYSEATRAYTPKKVGKIFATKFTQEAVSGAVPKRSLILYVQVAKQGGFKFSPKIALSEGYHKVMVAWKGSRWPFVSQDDDVQVSTITEGEWMAAKGLSASMLSHHDKQPAWAGW